MFGESDGIVTTYGYEGQVLLANEVVLDERAEMPEHHHFFLCFLLCWLFLFLDFFFFIHFDANVLKKNICNSISIFFYLIFFIFKFLSIISNGIRFTTFTKNRTIKEPLYPLIFWKVI